jgi:hypothetical protein
VTRLAALARQLVDTEPAALTQLAGAIVTIGLVFGADLDVEQTVGTLIAVQTVVALLVRAAVWSPATHADELEATFRSGVTAGHTSAVKDARFQGDCPDHLELHRPDEEPRRA